jgi:AraC-like DNA-binding protein
MPAIHQKKARTSKYTATQVQGWRKLMRDNGWERKELAEHLCLSKNTVQKILEAEAFGELRG